MVSFGWTPFKELSLFVNQLSKRYCQLQPCLRLFLFKRLLDITVSVSLLIVFLPVILLIIVFLKIRGNAPVFFVQDRVGFQNRLFTILKFTTMVADSAAKGTGDITVKDDPRLLHWGKFLRKCKLDEIPQLFATGIIKHAGWPQYLPIPQRKSCCFYQGCRGGAGLMLSP